MEIIWQVLYSLVESCNYLWGYWLLFRIPVKKKPISIGVYFLGNVLLCIAWMAAGGKEDMLSFHLLYGMIIPLFLLEEKRFKSFILIIDVMLATTVVNIIGVNGLQLLFHFPASHDSGITWMDVLKNSIFSVVAFCLYMWGKCMGKIQPKRLEYRFVHYVAITLGLLGISFEMGLIELIASGEKLSQRSYIGIEFFVGIACIIFLLVVLWLLRSTKEAEQYKREKEWLQIYQKQQEERVQEILSREEKVKRIRHDMKGHLLAVYAYLQKKQYDHAAAYLEKLEGDLNQTISKEYLGMEAADAIIGEMEEQMKQKGISFRWNGKMAGKIEIEEFDLCIIFMNILKNAIEACEKWEENSQKEIWLEIVGYEDQFYLIQGNPMKGRLHQDEEGNLITGKKDKDNHGLGSKNIKEVVEKYQGTIQYKQKENQFILEILMKNRK